MPEQTCSRLDVSPRQCLVADNATAAGMRFEHIGRHQRGSRAIDWRSRGADRVSGVDDGRSRESKTHDAGDPLVASAVAELLAH